MGITIDGEVRPGFEPVRDAFAQNFARRHELGGACCVYLRGEKVVDIWGGIRNKAAGERWQEDTMVLVYSTSKGLAAMTLALPLTRLARLRGAGRHLLAGIRPAGQGGDHRPPAAGPPGWAVRLRRTGGPGHTRRPRPAGRGHGAPETGLGPRHPARYHGLTLGFYEGELIRRVDPRHRSLGQFFQDEIATPLGLDFYIRVPETIPNARLAHLAGRRLALPRGFPLRLLLTAFTPRSNVYRSLGVNPGSEVVRDERWIYARNLEVPAGGGVGTARAIARAYGVFATGGRELGLRPETLAALAAPPTPPTNGFHDECLLADVRYSLGFAKPSPLWAFGNERSFGALGAGGSMGYADPDAGIGYGYVTSQMGTSLPGDPRDVALREALDSVIRSD
jgi:CubicO group peptidase (beta-lactamase class C family)